MAAADKNAPAAAAAPGEPKPSNAPLLLALVNVAAVLAAVGSLAYTKLIYKRPAITETGERTRLAEAHASPTPPAPPALVIFEPVTVNIAASPAQPKSADGSATQLQGKLHYANVGFALEVRDGNHKAEVEAMHDKIMDRLLGLVGRKQFHELTTVQGRYMLRSQILETVNIMAANRGKPEDTLPAVPTGDMKDGLVTNVYFTHFIVQ